MSKVQHHVATREPLSSCSPREQANPQPRAHSAAGADHPLISAEADR